ncbi:SMP-30/gluconolactonase/LRE family protein [Nitratireductor thuwali]|uniref:L-arabinolactonase n=1 Tax=Nitratireductor thuwali TaxID=2267699 RepID=A0ABY5MI24_9HYPH|nr:L-arabinolactonase [Nitratireductor thuwali]
MSSTGVSVLCGIACELGEGPAYDPAADTLFWFDILGRKMIELPLATGEALQHDLPVMASALAMVDHARQLLVTETGLQLRDRNTGDLTMLQEVETDRPNMRSNDARVHPCGALWLGTMGKAAEEGAGAIYWFYKGELRCLYPRITIPNSICFSPDGAIAFFADTRENRLYRVACDPELGLPVDDPILTIEGNEMAGGIDGSVVDAEGTLWNARWGGGRIDAWSSSGEFIRSIDMPASQVTCPVFIGHDASRMAVTSAHAGLSGQAREADSDAGRTFVLERSFNGRFDPPVVL